MAELVSIVSQTTIATPVARIIPAGTRSHLNMGCVQGVTERLLTS